MKLHNMIPMLNVSNIEKSLELYNLAVDFKLVSSEEDLRKYRWGIIRSGKTEMMLSEKDFNLGLKKTVDPQKNTSWPVLFYFYPDNVKELYKSIKENGIEVTPLEDTFYGMKELSAQDPDCHMLSFGQESDK